MVKILIDRYGLSPQQATDFDGLFSARSLQKGGRFHEAGKVCDQVGYLEEGILKCIYVRGEQEVVDEFVFPGSLVTCHHSFITNTPSRKAIVAISGSQLRIAKKKDIETLAAKHSFVERLSRRITEEHFLVVHDKLESLRLEDATTRYLNLLQKAPERVLLLPQYELASYLNVNPETLSRIRKKLATQNAFS